MIPLINLSQPDSETAAMIALACQDHGFFCIQNHGISPDLQSRLDSLSREFFDLPLMIKNRIHMKLGGHAWRGFFALGEELTSGKPDLKEGIYLGEQLEENDHRVKAGWPLHGKNLYPEINGFSETVEEYVTELTKLAHRLMELVSLSLGQRRDFIFDHYTKDPTLLFRIFHYPPQKNPEDGWGVGAHTDYGLLTILKQDDCGGLEVKTKDGWVDVPPLENVFVCNIGDMLELLTKGHYRSTLHRVRNKSGRERLSFPFFFDPNFEAMIAPIPTSKDLRALEEVERWDEKNLHQFQGKYRDYLIGKISKVFPDLAKGNLP
ncbi:MAG: 2OG-Fe(II) oxygenase family protein [Bdellovibrionota bacterium]